MEFFRKINKSQEIYNLPSEAMQCLVFCSEFDRKSQNKPQWPSKARLSSRNFTVDLMGDQRLKPK